MGVATNVVLMVGVKVEHNEFFNVEVTKEFRCEHKVTTGFCHICGAKGGSYKRKVSIPKIELPIEWEHSFVVNEKILDGKYYIFYDYLQDGKHTAPVYVGTYVKNLTGLNYSLPMASSLIKNQLLEYMQEALDIKECLKDHGIVINCEPMLYIIPYYS